MSRDIVGTWDVSDGVYRIEFEHGSTTGKRVIYINGKEVLRRDWMFKLVGKEMFPVGSTDTKATISIEAITGFSYEYTLEINGKSLQTFLDNRSKISKTWVLKLGGADYRIVLEKDTMDVWCNGQKMETMVSTFNTTVQTNTGYRRDGPQCGRTGNAPIFADKTRDIRKAPRR
uniref:Fas apoptotic inhibitory molecule b n=1 Tax=Sinocyclocheilus rhinocerous TaxID=307959 RepID=A0A673NLJ7_9TELE